MTKQADIDDLLGDEKPAKKTPAKKAAAPKADAPAAKKVPAKKAVAEKPVAAKKAAAPKAEKAEKEPISFDEGERDDLYKRIKKMVRKPINSRELAEKLEIPTRKLRVVLYSMVKREEISLEPGESKVQGMTVSPA